MLKQLSQCAAMGCAWLLSSAALAGESASLMSYQQASKAMDASQAYARDKGWKVMVLISDQNGLPVILKRMDGTSNSAFGYVTGKTLVVAQTGLGSGEYGAKLKLGEIDKIEGGSPYKGGVPVYVKGQLIGMIATSGVHGYQDLEVSLAGAQLIGSAFKP